MFIFKQFGTRSIVCTASQTELKYFWPELCYDSFKYPSVYKRISHHKCVKKKKMNEEHLMMADDTTNQILDVSHLPPYCSASGQPAALCPAAGRCWVWW